MRGKNAEQWILSEQTGDRPEISDNGVVHERVTVITLFVWQP